MKVIVFNSIKGGVGKSTLAAQFAAYLSRSKKVGILDGDAQSTLATWLERRAENDDKFLQNLSLLPQDYDFDKQNHNLDYCIIDLVGTDSKIARRLIGKYADFVISPLRPSQTDIDTVLKHNAVILESAEFNPKLKLFYLFNACNTHPKDKERGEAIEVMCYLIKEGEIAANLIESPIFERKILRSLFSEGLSCFDVGAKANQSKQEIEAVIKKILKGGKK